jgi:hypothetical protein
MMYLSSIDIVIVNMDFCCRSFHYEGNTLPDRHYTSIMGCIVRQHFPGLVKLPDGRTSVVCTWKHYLYPPDTEEEHDDECDNSQERVLSTFWVRFSLLSHHSETPGMVTLVDIPNFDA